MADGRTLIDLLEGSAAVRDRGLRFIDRSEGSSFVSWADLRDRHEPVAEPFAGRFNIIYTSGTTALPKGAARSITDPEDLAVFARAY